MASNVKQHLLSSNYIHSGLVVSESKSVSENCQYNEMRIELGKRLEF